VKNASPNFKDINHGIRQTYMVVVVRELADCRVDVCFALGRLDRNPRVKVTQFQSSKNPPTSQGQLRAGVKVKVSRIF
jgi:hypothetical protein